MCVSGPPRCKSCALTSRFFEKWLFRALCYQILALQTYEQALYGSVVELPGFFPPYLDAVQRNGQTILTGIVGNLMMHIIQALQLNCTFVKPADGRYGVLQNGTWSGKIGMLVRNEADISPGPFIMTSSRVSAAHPSFPWAYEDIVIFAGRPFQFSKNVFGFLSAFSGLVWFVIAVTLLATWAAYVACWAGALRPSSSGRLQAVRRRAEASSAFGLFVRTILSQGSEYLPTSMLQRILVALWLLGIIVLRTSYLGEMKAALVVRTDVSSIRGIEDVARDDSITPIVLQSSGFYWLFRTSKSETFQRVYKRIHRRRGNLPDKDMFSVTTLKQILKGKAVIIMMQTPVTASVRARCEQLGALDAEFYYAPNPISQIPMAMFMRKDIDPWFRNGVGEQTHLMSFLHTNHKRGSGTTTTTLADAGKLQQELIELLLERGFIQKYYRDAKSDEDPCRAESAQGQDRARSSSQLDTLQGVFLFWLLGIGFSGAFLCAECYCHRHRWPKSQTSGSK